VRDIRVWKVTLRWPVISSRSRVDSSSSSKVRARISTWDCCRFSIGVFRGLKEAGIRADRGRSRMEGGGCWPSAYGVS
jgi:hypothetical protein